MFVYSEEVGGDDTEFWKELGGKLPLDNIPVDDAEGDITSRDHIFLHKCVAFLSFFFSCTFLFVLYNIN
jgi:hypothetical protein